MRDTLIIVFSALGATVVFIATVVTMALKIQTFITQEFAKHRAIMRNQFRSRDKAIRRLELWAFKLNPADTDTFHFQPGADPLEFGEERAHGNGAD